MNNPYLKIRMAAARINAKEWKERLARLEAKPILANSKVLKPVTLFKAVTKTISSRRNPRMESLKLRMAISHSSEKLKEEVKELREKASLAGVLGSIPHGSSREGEVDLAISCLKATRLEFIEVDLAVEKGVMGMLRKLGFCGAKEENPSYVLLRNKYLGALDDFRGLVIEEFKKKKGFLFSASLKTIYRITVADEIERLKVEKERLWRRQGFKGFLRERIQDYRETSSGLKIILGVLLIFFGLFIFSFGKEILNLLSFLTIILGMVISLEGVHQEMSIIEGIRQELTRAQAFRRAFRRLGRGEAGLRERLRKIHLRLEEDIWQIRKFEKRAEVARFLSPILLGATLGAFLALSLGIFAALKVFISVFVVRFFLIVYLPLIPFKDSLRVNSESKQYSKEGEYPEEKAYI
jgi:hypothetical protein